jgi:hypothetical protein
MRNQVGQPGFVGRSGVLWFALQQISASSAETKRMGYLPEQPSFLIFDREYSKYQVFLSPPKSAHLAEGFISLECRTFETFAACINLYNIFKIKD